MSAATVDDVNLVLRLYELRREERLRDARRWFLESFKPPTIADFQALCPRGSEANESFRMVSTHWEMVASFITCGALNEQLFFESGRELLLVYVRVRRILPALREAQGNTRELANLETVALRFIAWWNAQSPGAFEAFAARVGG
jgi:hypothetical protein